MFISAGALPQRVLGSLQHSPKLSSITATIICCVVVVFAVNSKKKFKSWLEVGFFTGRKKVLKSNQTILLCA